MTRATELRDTLDDLTLSAEQIEELSQLYDLSALRDMLGRLYQETPIRNRLFRSLRLKASGSALS